MNNSELGINKFKDGYNCAQAVLFALKDYTGLSDDLSLKLASGFGAGMGRTQNVCGAVSGGILALNTIYGRDSIQGKEQQDESYLKVRNLIEKFENEHKTITCIELLDGCNLLTLEGQDRFSKENMRGQCENYVASAIKIVEDIISRET